MVVMKQTDATDEFGRDPQVRYLRLVFARIETAQKGFLEQLGVLPFDERLKRAREGALHLFERGWMISNREGIQLSEEELGLLYLACLARMLKSRGTIIPERLEPSGETIRGIMTELSE
jgi:hypothetical protein